MTTKERILIESMKLFSTKGFESVSIRTIAAAVGVGNSALYKHFSSKQEILDALVEISVRKFNNKYKELELGACNANDLNKICLKMFTFQTQDEWITMFRKILIIEQFKNPQMANIYKKLFVDMPINGQTQIFKQLIEAKVMKDNNPEVMAIQLYAPFFLYHTIGRDKDELEVLFKIHVDNFIKMYMEE